MSCVSCIGGQVLYQLSPHTLIDTLFQILSIVGYYEILNVVPGVKHFSFLSGAVLYTSAPVLEKAMAPHSSTLAWRIPWTEEPGRLQSMGVRHN